MYSTILPQTVKPVTWPIDHDSYWLEDHVACTASAVPFLTFLGRILNSPGTP